MFVTEDEMRRAQQRDQRLATEVRGHRFEHEVDRGGHRFRGERQRVDGLIRDARRRQRFGGEIQIRQRMLEDDGRTVERRRLAAATIRLDLTRDPDELLFPVPKRPPRIVGIRRRNEHRASRRSIL